MINKFFGIKIIYILIGILIFTCTTVAVMEDTQHYVIRCIVWDVDGNYDYDVDVTFTYGKYTYTLYTAPDGSVAFDTSNFIGISNGNNVEVSCVYGTKQVPVNYDIGCTGVTFNEPSQDTAITIFTAMGFIVTAIGGGIYWLRRKLKEGK